MDHARMSDALNNAYHRRRDRNWRDLGDWKKYGPFGKPVSSEQKAIEVAKIMTDEMWEETRRKAEHIGNFQELVDHYTPLCQHAEQEVINALNGGQLPPGVTVADVEKRAKFLTDGLAKVVKQKNDLIKDIAYIEKEQMNKIYTLNRAEKLAKKVFWDNIYVVTTKFLATDLPDAMSRALTELLRLLLHNPFEDRRQKD